jgi:hypothetical protein
MIEAPASLLTVIRLAAPEIEAHAVTFRWQIAPETSLYRKTSFRIDYPESIDCRAIPLRLWWIVAMLCLHPQWMLLRPCRIELPVRLGSGETEWWLRLMDAGTTTLEALRGTSDTTRSIEIVEGDEDLPEVTPLPDFGRCVAAFSGGKDSLLQAALLCELTKRPALVATTSPMKPFFDHETERRRQVFQDIIKRREVGFFEVKSDLRAIWANHFGWSEKRYPIAVSELSDAFLYFSNALIVGVSIGATHVFLASEAELQENAIVDGRVIQYKHFMYSGVTQRALSTLLAPFNLIYSSVSSPLHQDSVQRLLWTRYRDLADLQYSCWNVPLDAAACSQCASCLKNAMCVLAVNGDPALIGIDLPTLLAKLWRWNPWEADERAKSGVRGSIPAQIVANIKSVSLASFLAAVVDGRSGQLFAWRTWKALIAFAMLRHSLRKHRVVTPGWRPGFLRHVDALVRDRIGAVYAQYFTPEDEQDYAPLLERAEMLARWITEPLRRRESTNLSAARLPVLEPSSDFAD